MNGRHDHTTAVCASLLLGTAVRQTDFDVIIGQFVVSDRNLGCKILIIHSTLSDGEVGVCPLPWQLCALSHCRMTGSDCGCGPLDLVFVLQNGAQDFRRPGRISSGLSSDERKKIRLT